MLSLKLFGGACLEGEDGPLTGPAVQRHRLALLAVLATSYPRAVPRDKLLVYLWPDRDAEHARNLLNQAVHALRNALGEGAILNAGDELRFDPKTVSSDVVAFEEAVAAGDLERAARHYGGPFLDGFFLPGAPEFERWVDGERDRLRRAYCQALEVLAEKAAVAEDPKSGLEWWRRLTAEEPFNGRVTVRLMEVLEAAGDRAGALQQARLHTVLLREEFEAEPDPIVTALAERLRIEPSSVPRIADEVDLPASAANAPPHTLPDSHEDARAPPEQPPPTLASSTSPVHTQRVTWRNVALVGILVLGFAGVLSVGWLLQGSDLRLGAAMQASTPGNRAIAVLPFENLTGRDEDAAFSNGIHSDLITALSGVRSLTVISRTSVLPYRGQAKPLPRIGEELGVDVLLEGGVQRFRDRVRVNVQLSEAKTGRLLWAEGYDRELTVGNLFALQSEITERIVASLQTSLTASERERLVIPPTEDLTAYLYYHQAGAAYDGTRAGNDESERLLRLALEVDPGFAPAWAALATDHGWRPPYLGYPTSAWDSAVVYARRALEADPNDGRGYTALAVIYGHQGHLARQQRMAREAMRRNPSDVLATRRLAESYRGRGDFVEALRYHRESVTLSPNGLQLRTWVGYVYMDLGKLALADRWYRDVLTLQPDYMNALQGRVILHLQRGQADSALHYSERLVARYPDETIALANAAMVGHYLRDFERVQRYAGRAIEIAEPDAPVRELYSLLATSMLGFAHLQTGHRARADSLFDQSLAFLEGMVDSGTDTPRWPYEIALIHAARGDVERAITWLQSAYDHGFRWAWMLEREPMLDPLRQDLRFRGLAVRMQADVDEMRRRVS